MYNILVQICILMTITGYVVSQVTTGVVLQTIAGTGTGVYNGDGILATSANLYSPGGVAVNSLGEVIIADTSNNRIRKILLNGTIITIAGTGNIDDIRDGILATSVDLYIPSCVVVNSFGEVIISDGWSRIFKILLNGTIIRIAGTGTGTRYNGDGILATSATIGRTGGIAVNSLGEVVFTDNSNNRIFKILLNGTIITIAGNGTSGYNGDGILATSATVKNPFGIAINSLGEVIFSDSSNNRIRKILLNGTIITIAGTGTSGYNGDGILATSANLNYPYGVAVNSLGEVIISENNRIRKILLNGTIITIAGTGTAGYNGDGILATSATIGRPGGIAFNSLGEVFIADSQNNRIRKTQCPYNSTRNGDVCICLTGYYGPQCDKFDCNQMFFNSKDVCSSHGACIAPNNCSCSTDYFGSNCELYKCFGTLYNNPNVCSGFGKCTGYNQCLCNSGYYGTNCDTFDCNGNIFNDTSVCSLHGACIAPNNCSCSTGYFGSNCELYKCFGIVNTNKISCSGIGDCLSPDQCQCPTSTSISYNKDCSQNSSNGTNLVQPTDQTTVLLASIVPSVFVFVVIVVVFIIIIIILVVRSKRMKSHGHGDVLPNNPSSYEMKSFAHSNLISDFPSQYSTSSKLSQISDPMDRYTDLIKIGQGGFASVFRAKDTKAGNEIKAIKVIRFDNNDDLNMAMREGIQLLKMNHPNVLKVNDFFIGNGQILCIDMVFYEMGDLNSLIMSSSFCSERLVAQILMQSCSALDYIYKTYG